MSRLRKVIGAIVATQPYRLADTVEMTLRTDAERWQDRAFARSATSPRLRRRP